MLPVVAPRVRREASPGAFALGYTMVWVLAGGVLLAALWTGIRSLVMCGPLMVSMLASHSLLLMAALTAVMLGERLRVVSPAPEARPLVA